MKIGILGGSGLYEIEGIESVKEVCLETAFGSPSDAFITGRLADREVVFLPRHGRGHRLLPSEINHRANIIGFKQLGVDCVLSVSAVGSLKESIHPRDIVLPDQYFDRTKKSLEHTFFGGGIVAHVAFSDPTCPVLAQACADVAAKVIAEGDEDTESTVHHGGTYVNMEGPAFSTRAESNAYRGFGFDVIGMTSLGEAKLCREAELCYQAMAMVTDYDCWHETEEAVNVQVVVGHLIANTKRAKRILPELIAAIPETRDCACGSALENAILTHSDAVSDAVKERLSPIVGKYMGPG